MPDGSWYLGLDVGTIGISATLLHRPSDRLYSIYWSDVTPVLPETERLRLPAMLYASINPDSSTTDESGLNFIPLAIGTLTESLARFSRTVAQPADRVLLRQLKPQLEYQSAPASERAIERRQALQILLSTLTTASARSSHYAVTSMLRCGAVGLSSKEFQTAIEQLSHVFVGYPTGWSAAYRTQLQSAILEARLVDRPEQVTYVDEGIAAAIASILPGKAQSRGKRLAIDVGATCTHLALLDIPAEWRTLTLENCQCFSLPYASDAVDQDILSTLLNDRPDLQKQLGLENLALPQVGQADREKRQLLQQQLDRLSIGYSLSAEMQTLKQHLVQQETGTLKLNGAQYPLRRSSLDAILQRYIPQVGAAIDQLLAQASSASEDVPQIVCRGGMTISDAIVQSLRERFPFAAIVAEPGNNNAVAQGLAAIGLCDAIGNYFLRKGR